MRVESLQPLLAFLSQCLLASFSTLHAGRVAATACDAANQLRIKGLSVPSMRVESLQQGRSSRGLLSRLTFSTLHAGRVAATPAGCPRRHPCLTSFSTLHAGRVAATTHIEQAIHQPIRLSVPSMRVESLQPGHEWIY